MALLGPETRFTTNVYGKLNAGTGIVTGDLVIVGGGDASFGTSDSSAANGAGTSALTELTNLADQLKLKGVHRITGKIVGDDQLFAREPPPEGWAAEDLMWAYGALPNALSLGDNQLRLTAKPRPAKRTSDSSRDTAAILQLEQIIPYLHLANNVDTDTPEGGQKDHVDVEPIPGRPRDIAVLGSISPGSAPIVERIALPDPALYTAEALRSVLSGSGVTVTGPATTWHSTDASPPPFLSALRAPEDCETSVVHDAQCSVECSSLPHPDQLLAQHTSEPLAADVKFTLKTSANLHAEVLLRQLEAKNTCAGASALGGARILRAWLLQAGLSDHDFVLYDGSGLSTKDLVTPRSEAQLLAYAGTQPWFGQWKASLPIAGVDGTLSGRFTNSPLKSKVFAKTGTLGESRALAGFVQCASGREVIFAIMVDNHDPGSNAERVAMDKIVEAIAAGN